MAITASLSRRPCRLVSYGYPKIAKTSVETNKKGTYSGLLSEKTGVISQPPGHVPRGTERHSPRCCYISSKDLEQPEGHTQIEEERDERPGETSLDKRLARRLAPPGIAQNTRYRSYKTDGHGRLQPSEVEIDADQKQHKDKKGYQLHVAETVQRFPFHNTTLFYSSPAPMQRGIARGVLQLYLNQVSPILNNRADSYLVSAIKHRYWHRWHSTR